MPSASSTHSSSADGAVEAGLFGDASSARDGRSAPREASGSPIDCAKAGGGKRHDSGFLPGLFTARIDLAQFCATFGCPYGNVRDFLDVHTCAEIEASGYAPDTLYIVGCGVKSVGGIALFGGTEYFFDESTGALVGAMIGSDTSFGPCEAASYVAGTVIYSCDRRSVFNCRAIP